MSSYFDCCVERKREDNTWTLITESTYTDDLDIINPYILKGVFWDTDHYQKLADMNDKLSQKTILSFGSKIEKNRWPISTTYRYEERLKPYDCNSIYLVDVLNCIYHDVSVRWNEIWIPFSKEFINKNFEKFEKYFSYIDGSARKQVSSANNIDDCINELENFKILNSMWSDTVYMYFSSAGDAIQSLKYHLLKDISDTTQLITSILITEYFRKDENGEEIIVPQYELDNVKISNLEDIQLMITDVQKSLKNYEIQNTVENLAKTFIKNEFLNFASEEDLKTQLGERLRNFVGDTDAYEDDDYKEELESQLKELKLLIRLVGSNGRLIWRIS